MLVVIAMAAHAVTLVETDVGMTEARADTQGMTAMAAHAVTSTEVGAGKT